ncbi:beta-secretase isoform X2 [Anabrus simplex]|uniref:beta-secretase isoform X2 n=1 Tax=Anabrus simplex TaxID=316456 RepID=UPI0035A30DA8
MEAQRQFYVLVDTGSTNFAIAASETPDTDVFFSPSNSSTFRPLDGEVSVTYTQGCWKGHLGSDVVQFPNMSAPVVRCDISLIESSNNFYMKGAFWQGILGLGYPTIAQPNSNMVSWLEAVHMKNPNYSITFSLELCGAGSGPSFHIGSFQFLGDEKPFTSTFSSPIIREWFYEISLVGIHVGNETIDLPCEEFNNDKTIIDSGTTSLRLPNKVFQKLVQLLEAEVVIHGLSIPSEFWYQSKVLCGEVYSNMDNFPNLKLSVIQSESSYFIAELSPHSYIRKVYDTSENPGHENCYKFAVESSDTGTVLGVVLMEGLIVVFNQTNKTVYFNESVCGPPVKLYGPFQTDTDLRKCSKFSNTGSPSALVITALVIGTLVVILLYIKGLWLWERCNTRRLRPSGSCETLVNE